MNPFISLSYLTHVLGAAVCGLFTAALTLILIRRRVPLRSRNGLVLTMGIMLGLAGVNWIIGVGSIEYSMIGGSAQHGKVVGDHYFLGSHGRYVEVSRDGYWLSLWYTYLSQLAASIPFVVLLVLGMLRTRRSCSPWVTRVRDLGSHDDLESLYELIDLIDYPLPIGGCPSTEARRVLGEVIRRRTSFIKVACPLPLSEFAAPEILKEQKEMWRAWVQSHEADLRKGGKAAQQSPSPRRGP